MRAVRWSVLVMASLLLCAQGNFARSGQEGQDAGSERLVIDPENSSLLRQGFYLEDLTAVLTPVLNPAFLGWTGKHDAEIELGLTALLTAGVREVTVLVSRKDFLSTLELPEGDLDRLAQGDISVEALSAAFGVKAGSAIGPLLQPLKETIQANIQPNIHRITQDCFFSVIGKRLLLGSTDILVEVSRKKLLEGNQITAIPDKGQQLWAKTDLQVRCAPSEEGQFSNKNLSYEYAVHKTPQGFDYSFASNLPDILPALERQEPLLLDDMPLFGARPPFYSFVFSPKLFAILGQISVKGVTNEDLGLPSSEQIPDSFGDIERVGLFLGGPKAQVLGYPIPGVMLGIKGTPEIMSMLQGLLVGIVPVQWAEKKLEGWDAFFTADALIIDQTPIPMPLFFGRRGGNLLCGVMNHDELGLPQDGGVILAHLPAGVKTSAFMDMDVQGIWTTTGEILKPGSTLRIISKIDSTWTPEQIRAFEAILHTSLPVQRATAWNSPDLRQSEGRIVESSESGDFMPRLCDLVDAFLPRQAGK